MPQIEPWTLLSPDAPLHVADGLTLLVSPIQPSAGEVRVLEIKVGHREATIRHAVLGATEAARKDLAPDHRRVNEFCAEAFGSRVDHVLVVPPASWSTRTGFFAPRTVTAIHHHEGSTGTFEAHHLIERIAALPPPEGALPREAPTPASEVARARVEAVKERYGALASDIAYRIENSALFDPGAPLTRQYHLLMMRWGDEAARLDATASERLAMEIQLAFDTARSHAEAIGFGHLPSTARPTAGRALKAAILAREATTEGEREAAISQVIRLLDSIALYYLPAVADVPVMLGGATPQVGRPA